MWHARQCWTLYMMGWPMLLTALLLRHIKFVMRKGNSNCRAPMDASCERDDP